MARTEAERKIGVVLGSFHRQAVEEMRDEARKTARACGLTIVREVWVPGSMEKPLAIKRMLDSDEIEGVVALGIIERGETKHGMVMGEAIFSAIVQLQLETDKPVGVGILGPEILPRQIPSRLRLYAGKAVRAVQAML